MIKIRIYQQQPAGYKAFIPAPLPPAKLIDWDNDLIELFSKADRAIGRPKKVIKFL